LHTLLMPESIPGIHHVTAVGSDPSGNLDFYTRVLGLRLVKRSVNQDDVSVYHLFYADDEGSPGTSMTFFPYQSTSQGQVGTGQVSTTQFLVPEDSAEYWHERLEDEDVDVDEPMERFGDAVVPFRDPDGLRLELVEADAPDDYPHPRDSPVPVEHGIRGFFGVTLCLTSADSTENLLKAMGYRHTETNAEGRRKRYESDGELGRVVDVHEDPQAPRGRPGAGTVHHVAFRVTKGNQRDWRDVLKEQGLRPTSVIDRKWFESVYARTRGGVLFELATDGPGYTVDEELDSLGEKLVLPDWLEGRRDEIEGALPELG